MPRNMSFMLTTEQMRKRTKTVTRRLGWWNVEPGEILNACEQCQGLRKGEKVKVICQIRVLNVTDTRLGDITWGDVDREGFPRMFPPEFIQVFVGAHKGCTPDTIVNRIEFEYVEGG